MSATTSPYLSVCPVHITLGTHWHHVKTLHSSQSGCLSMYFKCSWKMPDVGFQPCHSLHPDHKVMPRDNHEGLLQSQRKSADSLLWLERKTHMMAIKHNEWPLCPDEWERKKNKQGMKHMQTLSKNLQHNWNNVQISLECNPNSNVQQRTLQKILNKLQSLKQNKKFSVLHGKSWWNLLYDKEFSNWMLYPQLVQAL